MFNFLFSLLLEVHFLNAPGGSVRTVHHLLVLITVLAVLAGPAEGPHVVDRVRPGGRGNLTGEVPTLVEHHSFLVMVDLIPITGSVNVIRKEPPTQSVAAWNSKFILFLVMDFIITLPPPRLWTFDIVLNLLVGCRPMELLVLIPPTRVIPLMALEVGYGLFPRVVPETATKYFLLHQMLLFRVYLWRNSKYINSYLKPFHFVFQLLYTFLYILQKCNIFYYFLILGDFNSLLMSTCNDEVLIRIYLTLSVFIVKNV